MIRGGKAELICPNVPLVKLRFPSGGGISSSQLNALKASARTSMAWLPIGNERVRARSTFLLYGPRTEFRDMLPKVPSAGAMNAVGSSHRTNPFAGLVDPSA